MAAISRRLATTLLALLLAGPACGKKGDPQPPLRRSPQGPSELAVAQRGLQVVLSLRAPRAWSDGSRLPVLELELLRAEGEGDFAKLARARRLRAVPGEALSESEPAPAPGTRLRFAVRTRADGKQSALSAVIALEVQAPPPPPSALMAERGDGQVRLAWTPPPGAPSESSPPTVPTPPGFWIYRRALDASYGGPLSKAPVAEPRFEDETPPQPAACYVVRTVVSSDPVIESADSNEACVPAAAPQPGASPGAGLP